MERVSKPVRRFHHIHVERKGALKWALGILESGEMKEGKRI